MLLSQFSGSWRHGPGGGWKVPEKGLKMVSGWPWGVKNTLQYALWRQSDQNGPFGGDLAPRVRHFAECRTAREKRRFTKFLVEIPRPIRVFARGPGTFYFWHLKSFFSLPERGFGTIFCFFMSCSFGRAFWPVFGPMSVHVGGWL